MEAKEKAKELIDKFTFTCREWDYEDNSKQCALIAVDEILNRNNFLISIPLKDIEYWNEVKNEIEKL